MLLTDTAYKKLFHAGNVNEVMTSGGARGRHTEANTEPIKTNLHDSFEFSSCRSTLCLFRRKPEPLAMAPTTERIRSSCAWSVVILLLLFLLGYVLRYGLILCFADLRTAVDILG